MPRLVEDPADYLSGAVHAWIATFLRAVDVAVDQPRMFITRLEEMREQWTERYLAHRQENGAVRQPRADSASMRLLPMLPEVPVLTPLSAQRLLHITTPAARAALDELASAGILARKGGRPGHHRLPRPRHPRPAHVHRRPACEHQVGHPGFRAEAGRAGPPAALMTQ